MTAGLALLGVFAPARSIVATAVALAVFGLGFGGVSQVLMIAVQSSVDRSARLGAATAATTFFRALGGSVSAAVLGLVFAAHAGEKRTDAGGPSCAAALDIIDGVQTVFLVAAPLAALALLLVLRLPEAPLQTRLATAKS